MESPTPEPLFGRRSFIGRLSWALLGTSVGASILAAMGALLPRVRPSLASLVVLARPEEFAVGEVSERWKKEHRLFLVRTAEGFYALKSVCTHLGCVPGWQQSQKKFKCFCHGSGFHPDGVNFEGPAPRPLERLRIGLDAQGRIIVDTAVAYRADNGGWKHKDAFLPWKGIA